MKKFTLYLLLLGALFVFPHAVFAQKSPTAKAFELMTEGKFKDAIAVLDKAVEKNKDLYAIYKLRAALKRMTGDFEGALNDFSLAIEQKADDGEIYEQRAMMRLYTRKDPALILADLDAAISYGRKHEKVYATRGMIRAQLRDFDGAIADYETAIGLRPDYAGAYLGLSGVYGINRNEEKSAEVLEKFIAMVENSGSKTEKVNGEVVASSGANQLPTISGDKNPVMKEGSVIIKGRSTTGVSTPTSGAEMNDSAFKLEQTKNTAAAYSGLAAIYQRRKDNEKASLLVEKALAIDPQDFSGLHIRGKIRTDSGNYAGAISDFDAALKLMPNNPPVYLHRGIAKLLSGSEADAQKDFDKFLQLFPNGKMMLETEVQRAKEKLPQQ
jgi:tetratricopeptide (TPR) repeat protein